MTVHRFGKIRPFLRVYTVLWAMGIIVLGAQVRYLVGLSNFICDHSTYIEVPFEVDAECRVLRTSQTYAADGVSFGDRVFLGSPQQACDANTWRNLFALKRPGDELVFVAQEKGQAQQRHKVVLRSSRNSPTNASDWLLAALIFVVAPVGVLILFVVVLRIRPDPAGLALGLLLIVFSQLFDQPDVDVRLPVLVLAIRMFVRRLLPFALICFTISFPRPPRWGRTKWLMLRLALLGVITNAVIITFLSVGWHDGRLTKPRHLITDQAATTTQSVVLVIAIVLLTVQLLIRVFATQDSDTRRRFRVLLVGTTLCCGPTVTLNVIAAFRHTDPVADLNTKAVLLSVVALDCLPFLLAYVVMIRRALPLRVLLLEIIRTMTEAPTLELTRLSGVVACFAYVFAISSHLTTTRALSLTAILGMSAELCLNKLFIKWLSRYFNEAPTSPNTNGLLISRGPERLPDLLNTLAAEIRNTFGSRTAHIATVSSFVPMAVSGDSACSVIIADTILTNSLEEESFPVQVHWDNPNGWMRFVGSSSREYCEVNRIAVLAPILQHHKLIAVALLGVKYSDEPYLRAELRQIGQICEHAALRLENARLLSNLELGIAEREKQNAERELLRQASKAKSDFLAHMSHELRTPLNAIIGYSEILLENPELDPQGSIAVDLGRIRGAGRHLLALIDSILDISKIEAGKVELYLESVSLAKILTEVESMSTTLVVKNNNRLSIDKPDLAMLITTDIVKVRQVLFNLISNAAKFTKHGSIHVRPTESARAIALSVSDTGIGMTPSEVEKLFTPFAQANPTISAQFGGTGLGLSISRQYCRLLGGDLQCTSVAGVGTTFLVTLPKYSVTGVPKQDDTDAATTAPEHSETTVWGNINILLVGGDPTTEEMVRRALFGIPHTLSVTLRGEDAVEWVRRVKPAVVVLDLLMEGVGGPEVLRRLKVNSETTEIPRILLSTIDSLKPQLSQEDYLIKPLDMGVLRAMLLRCFV